MKKYKKLFLQLRLTALFLFLIILTGFGLRFLRIKIEQQPIFADEAIYVRWAQVMKADPTLRFLPLSDGKQPLYMWILMFILQEDSDPLIIGRLLSAIAGVFTGIGIFFLAYFLFKSKNISLVAVLIYSLSPFSVFFDSMALVDSTLSMFGIWVLVFGVLSARYLKFDLSMLTGFFLGGALLTKSPAIFYSLLLPFSWIFSDSAIQKKKETKDIIVYLIKLAILFTPAYLIAYGMYNILRLGPNFHLISLRNKDYVFPLNHLWRNPKDPFIFHIAEIAVWFWELGPGVLVFLIMLGLIVGLKKYKKGILFLLIFILVPLLVNSLYAKVFTARYILYTLPLIFIVAALFIEFSIKYTILTNLLLALFIFSSILVNSLFIFDIQSAPLPRNERSGYLEEWTAGYGIKEVSQFIRDEYEKNPKTKIVVGTEGYFGTLPDGLQIYLNNIPEITIIGVGLDIKEVPKSLKDSKASGNETFLVINSSRLKANPENLGLELIAVYPKALRKPDSREYNLLGPRETLYLFRLK